MRTPLYLSLLLFVFIGCNRDDCSVDVNLNVDETQLAADIAAIDFYLDANGIEAIEHPSGLRYVILEPGDGDRISLCDNVVVDYRGTLLNGTEFDKSSRPIGLSMRSLIEGWKIGIPLIRERGAIELYIPSVYAYGENERSTIPANSNLYFKIDLYVIQ